MSQHEMNDLRLRTLVRSQVALEAAEWAGSEDGDFCGVCRSHKPVHATLCPLAKALGMLGECFAEKPLANPPA